MPPKINTKIIEKKFNECTRQDLLQYFGLELTFESEYLETWLSATCELSDFEQEFLNQLHTNSRYHLDFWQEADLRDNFIAPIISLVNFKSIHYKFSSFSERLLKASTNNITLKGKVEWMVAMGLNTPDLPFFFIHEYKQEEGVTTDGRGQLLAAMLTAQIIQQNTPKEELFNPNFRLSKDTPIYGCYVLGRMWFFITLVGKKYAISEAYDALKINRLQQILCILKRQKEIIINQIT